MRKFTLNTINFFNRRKLEYIETVCGIIPYYFIDKNGKLIFLATKNKKGYWEFSKGHIDEDENYSECALREFEEETGLDKNKVQVNENKKFEFKTNKQKDHILFGKI